MQTTQNNGLIANGIGGMKMKTQITFAEAKNKIKSMIEDEGMTVLEATDKLCREFQVMKRRGGMAFAHGKSLACAIYGHKARLRRRNAEAKRKSRTQEAGKESRIAVTAMSARTTPTPTTPHRAFYHSVRRILELPLSDKAKLNAIKAIV